MRLDTQGDGEMFATIECHRNTLTYTVRIYSAEGVELLSEWCSSYRCAERVARQHEVLRISNVG